MLREIQIRNYAVIDKLELEFQTGMTVLTGETGAGKSILVGALGLALGDRADAGVIRDGSDSTEVSALFEPDKSLLSWLAEQELEADGECLVRRSVSREGRSRAWINGHAVTLQTLRELASRLVDIHGQHLHQSLTQKHVQRRILDDSGNHKKLTNKVAEDYQHWQEVATELEELEQAQTDRESRLDLLRFQVRELDALGLTVGEPETLLEEQQRLAHAARLAEGTAETQRLLSDDDNTSVQQLLGQAGRLLSPLSAIDPKLAEIVALLNEAEIQVDEAASRLADYCEALDMDPAHRDRIEERLASLQALSRKHRVEASELPQHTEVLKQDLLRLEDADTHLDGLRQALKKANADYLKSATALSKARHSSGKKLDKNISSAMEELGMPGGQFVTSIKTDTERHHLTGIDDIEFQVSANPGQSPRPLARVASGGELSRISLAIEVMATDNQSVPTLVFDEIDTGIGGGIAEIVGQKLREVGSTAQVLCVTHLPQVASQAQQHIRVSKKTDGKMTRTSLTLLNDEQRTEELARMLGGVEITKTTRDHAREMIRRAAQPRRTRKKSA